MKTGLLRSTIQGAVAVGVSLLVVKLPAVEPYLSTELQALIVGVLVPLVVAAQLKIEKVFPALGSALRSPVYGPVVRETVATGIELLAQNTLQINDDLRQHAYELNEKTVKLSRANIEQELRISTLRQIADDLVAELRNADGELEDLDGDGDVDEDDAALANL